MPFFTRVKQANAFVWIYLWLLSYVELLDCLQSQSCMQNILVKMMIDNAGFCVLVVFWKHPCSYCYIVPIHCTSFLNCRSSPPKDRCVTNASQKSYFDEFIKSYHVKLKKMKITFMIFLVMKVILDFIRQHFKRWGSWLNRTMLNKYDKATLEKFIL